MVRDRALKFLHLKIKTEGRDLLSTKDTEAVLLEEIKHSIEECTADEFKMFMAMLAATSLQKTISGQSMIVELISHSCQLDKGSFDIHDDEAIDRFIHCTNAALPYFSVSRLAPKRAPKFYSDYSGYASGLSVEDELPRKLFLPGWKNN